MKRSAHTWLFPAIMAMGFLASGFQALTGIRLGFGPPQTRTTTRLMGVVGMLVSGGLLVYWVLAIGPG